MTNEEKLKKFWRMLSKTLVAVYSSPKVTVAAVAGACPAGGCCLALCCDLRVITADGAMGLNEVALGTSARNAKICAGFALRLLMNDPPS